MGYEFSRGFITLNYEFVNNADRQVVVFIQILAFGNLIVSTIPFIKLILTKIKNVEKKIENKLLLKI